MFYRITENFKTKKSFFRVFLEIIQKSVLSKRQAENLASYGISAHNLAQAHGRGGTGWPCYPTEGEGGSA